MTGYLMGGTFFNINCTNKQLFCTIVNLITEC